MFCKNFSTLTEPLTKLTKKDAPFIWGKEQDAQEAIIQLITHAPVLAQPDLS